MSDNHQVFSDDFAHQYVCHYTSRVVFLEHILPSLRLRMSRFRNVNDPRESRAWYCSLLVPDELMENGWDVVAISDRFTEHMKANAKLLCVTQDDPVLSANRSDHMYGRAYAHPSLWHRYGGQHGGVCLMLDLRALDQSVKLAAASRGDLYAGPVAYADQPQNEPHAFTLRGAAIKANGEAWVFAQHQRDHHDALYFSKSSDWASESEYRWVLLDGTAEDVYVDISTCLRGVIFGEDFPASDAEGVALMLGPRDVTLGRIKYRNGHPIVLSHHSSERETDSGE